MKFVTETPGISTDIGTIRKHLCVLFLLELILKALLHLKDFTFGYFVIFVSAMIEDNVDFPAPFGPHNRVYFSCF